MKLRKTFWVLLLAGLLGVGCATTRGDLKSSEPLDLFGGLDAFCPDPEYGLTEEKPILVGGGLLEGVQNEHDYLRRLVCVDGHALHYKRLGSCCIFETPNSPFGKGLLDVYQVECDDGKHKALLYLNMYDKGEVFAPRGFRFKSYSLRDYIAPDVEPEPFSHPFN